jgi:hypothetical protein
MVTTETRRIALHESCHAVIGLLAGVDITEVSLDPPVTNFTGRGAPNQRCVLQEFALTLAPVAAQPVFGFDPFLADDMEQAKILGAQLQAVDRKEYGQRLLDILHGEIAANAELIEEVAGALIRHKHLDGAEVRRIIAERRT